MSTRVPSPLPPSTLAGPMSTEIWSPSNRSRLEPGVGQHRDLRARRTNPRRPRPGRGSGGRCRSSPPGCRRRSKRSIVTSAPVAGSAFVARITPSAPTPRWRSHKARAVDLVDRLGAVAVEQDQEVVAQALVLLEADHRSAQFPSRVGARRAGLPRPSTTGSGDRGGTTPAAGGRRRGCAERLPRPPRRACTGRRGARAARGSRGPGERCATRASAAAASGAHLVDEPGRQLCVVARRRCAASTHLARQRPRRPGRNAVGG